ncbi:TlyA family RNA methyltransferase [Canibacter zhuwentaonis]|uniref:TlyA family RNA methyltransferase n=1 Tax=Canibacter zhuwentaonis TaxID=2837491 RepID=UPI0020281470|nr:TlyA family RNA methyltransferase [Canibacter zhuwentaonis]
MNQKQTLPRARAAASCARSPGRKQTPESVGQLMPVDVFVVAQGLMPTQGLAHEPAQESVRCAVWGDPPLRLDLALTVLGFVSTRNGAQKLIAAEAVAVNGKTMQKPALKVNPGDAVEVLHGNWYVSRAAHKLAAGLQAFEVSAAGKIALDLGASTGGFTQVLLEHQARAVVALDVGSGQLVPELRADPRVHVVENFNARYLSTDALRELVGAELATPELVVGDLSFISLTLILPAIASLAAPGADAVLLIKPQFEVGRERVKGGIVKSAQNRLDAVNRVCECALEHGLIPRQIVQSPLAGTHGNVEYLVYFASDTQYDRAQWDRRLSAVVTLD